MIGFGIHTTHISSLWSSSKLLCMWQWRDWRFWFLMLCVRCGDHQQIDEPDSFSSPSLFNFFLPCRKVITAMQTFWLIEHWGNTKKKLASPKTKINFDLVSHISSTTIIIITTIHTFIIKSHANQFPPQCHVAESCHHEQPNWTFFKTNYCEMWCHAL